MSGLRFRRQRDPERDARLTEAFHAWLRQLRAPRRRRYRMKVYGYVRMDVRMLK